MKTLPPDNLVSFELPQNTKKESPKFPDIDGSEGKVRVLNTDQNLLALANYIDIDFRLNMMTFEPEIYKKSNGVTISLSNEQLRSKLKSDAIRHGLTKQAIDDHLVALCENSPYHPIKNWLDSSQWDGVYRVDEVIACLNAKDTKLANIVMKRWLVGCVASLYEPIFKSKLVPILQGSQSFRKTAFIERIAQIMPMAFLEGAELNPDNKDSVLSCIKSFIIELGELERTSKNSQGSLKAHITKSIDSVRPPYARADIKKPRQSHLIASVNGKDFLKDETGSSRFFVIEMLKPADMNKLNDLLGWQYNGTGSLKHVKPHLLLQFWLEIKEMYQANFGWMMTELEVQQASKINEPFNDKGTWYDYVLGVYLNGSDYNMLPEWFSAADIVKEDPKLAANSTKQIGIALSALEKNGYLQKDTRRGGRKFYKKKSSPPFKQPKTNYE